MKPAEKLVEVIINSPLYPHWLEWKKSKEANNYILRSIHGKVIEVGAGDGTMKQALVKKYPKIKDYIATDYSSWDSEYKRFEKKIQGFGIFSTLWGYKKHLKLDNICNAESLPYKNNSFDYHISFEVLEHIENPDKYFKEAVRVVKRGGKIIIVIPFLFRMHGGEPENKLDFQRFSNGYFYKIAKENNLKILKIYSNTGLGTTLASMTNQWMISRLEKLKSPMRYIFFPLSGIPFTISNLIGYIIDLNPDKRFATRLHVVLEKK